MEKVITYNFSEDFIKNFAEYLCNDFLKNGNDLSHIACVFGGKRPALFLRKELAKKIKRAFIPPRIFSIDEFVDYSIKNKKHTLNISGLDSHFLVYNLAKKYLKDLTKKRITFSEFIPWARELISFIEQLDLEDISMSSLKNIEKSANIGYEIPDNINILLEHIVALRNAYRKELSKRNIYSKGMRYSQASEDISKTDFSEFEAIIFCNFFYLHKTEQKIIKSVLEKNKGICIFQGGQNNWSVLKKNALQLQLDIKSEDSPMVRDISLYQGFDIHSQVCLVREILKKIDKRGEKTVIVVPKPEAIIPLLTEISSLVKDLNVSMGYPLKRSSVYALFNVLIKAQESKKNTKYYTRDYLNVLQHPLIKNLELGRNSHILSVIVDKIEGLIQGSEQSSITGSLFLSLKDIENEEKVYLQAIDVLKGEVSIQECEDVLSELHRIVFKVWEETNNFKIFAKNLKLLVKNFTDEDKVLNSPFNYKVIDKVNSVVEELQNCFFNEEAFDSLEMWEVFKQKLETEVISFKGSPLKGLQILGLFETRSLNFDNVIIMDANESALPKLKIHEPLIPREVMLNLGLNRLEKEEEIQRYQLMRLIAGAKNVHFVYQENQEKEKSRFIEELLWKKQKYENKLKVVKPLKVSFRIDNKRKTSKIEKTPQILEVLKKAVYSASRINTYLSCPQQFYFKYVLGLKENQDLLENPDAAAIGTFIHELLEESFIVFKTKKPLIDSDFRKFFFNLMDKNFENKIAKRMRSDAFLLKGIIRSRLENFLDNEVERDVKKIICIEEKLKDEMILGPRKIDFQFTMDRIDELADGSILVIDYKTGGSNYLPKNLKALQNMEMSRKSIKDNIKSFQLPIYYYFVAKKYPGLSVNAELYNIRNLERKALFSKSDFAMRDDIVDLALSALSVIFDELFDINTCFEADRNDRRCQYCPFLGLCN